MKTKFTPQELLTVAQRAMSLEAGRFHWQIWGDQVYKTNSKTDALHEAFNPETNHEQWRALAEFCAENCILVMKDFCELENKKIYVAFDDADSLLVGGDTQVQAMIAAVAAKLEEKDCG